VRKEHLHAVKEIVKNKNNEKSIFPLRTPNYSKMSNEDIVKDLVQSEF
jgi:hypothetical protein